MKKIFYALLLSVFVLTMTVGAADAAWITGFETSKRVLQNADSTLLTGVTGSTDISYRLVAGETLATNDPITLTLGGGAKFATTAPTITGTHGAFAIVGSAEGASTANFRASVAAVGTDLTINTSAALFDLRSITGPVTFNIKAVTSVGSMTIFDRTTTVNPFATPSAMETVTITATTSTAIVAATGGAYTKFTGNATASAANTFSYKNLSGSGTALDSVPNQRDIAATKVVFKINGTMTGITTISGTGCTGSDSTGSQTGGSAGFFKVSGSDMYCSNTATIAPDTTLALAPVFTINGTTAQAARSFTASVAFKAETNKWGAHDAGTAATVFSIARDGSSFVTNSVGARNTIKITDRSGGLGTGGNVTVVAYDANGNSLTDSGAALTLPNNGTLTITGTALAARFTAGTAMRYDFSVESSSIVVTNVKASTDGSMSATTIFTSATATANGVGQGI